MLHQQSKFLILQQDYSQEKNQPIQYYNIGKEKEKWQAFLGSWSSWLDK